MWAKVFVALLTLHGLIHLMGFAKAFGDADLPQLTQPISRPLGLAWLLATLLMGLTATLLATGARGWWAVGLVAVLVSQAVIVTSWTDAWAGTIANVLVLLGLAYGFAATGPYSFAAHYSRQVASRVAATAPGGTLTEHDLAPLPLPVQRYLRQAGVVGAPRVTHVRAVWQGRIRGGPDQPWMPFTAEQYDFVDEPARFFHMHARRSGLPVDVYHSFTRDAVTMRARVLSVVPVVNASGADLRRAELVTILNDLAVLAPGALVTPALRWEPVGDREALAHYTVGGETVSARLIFNARDELVDFVSDDRLAASGDGRTLTPRRWSTPLGRYQPFRGQRLARHGEGRWHPPEGAFTYIELVLVDCEINGA